ncbi:14 kDa phosphohistidine phosphatase, partial [Alligator sinensis]|uniref:14 kDa phosphohistidine phosphatase n=1 Tax=Alligator sinensis TaxID=38654 RepID=A0A3Q0GGL4_ALLSI
GRQLSACRGRPGAPGPGPRPGWGPSGVCLHKPPPCTADIYEQAAAELEPRGFKCECLGGGRIAHRSAERRIHVYGYSVGFGRAKHSVSTEKLKAKYPDYEVTWADEGY